MNLKVIVVDDDPASASVLSQLLRRLGCVVTPFSGAAQALPAALGGAVDLVCLDLQMPGLDGRQALTLIRSHEYSQRAPSVPVIAVSAHVSVADRADAIADGFAAHLAKPVLVERMQQVVARTMLLRSALQRTRYSTDRPQIQAHMDSLSHLAAAAARHTASGVALAVEQQGRAALQQALRHALTGGAGAAREPVERYATMVANLGAHGLAAGLQLMLARFEQGDEDEGVTAAVLARAELDRVVFTLREQVRGC